MLGHYAGTVAEYLVRRAHLASSAPEDVAILTQGLVPLEKVVTEAEELRAHVGLSEGLISAAQLAAFGVIVELLARSGRR